MGAYVLVPLPFPCENNTGLQAAGLASSVSEKESIRHLVGTASSSCHPVTAFKGTSCSESSVLQLRASDRKGRGSLELDGRTIFGFKTFPPQRLLCRPGWG